MAGHLERIPEKVRAHLQRVARASGLGDAAMEALARAWLAKKGSFEEQVRRFSMQEVEQLDANEERGFLVMTYSGSLIKVGPLVEGCRCVEYASIAARADVPETAMAREAVLAAPVRIGDVVKLRRGPIRSSSPAFKIAVFANPLGVAEQEERLATLARTLAEEFTQADRALRDGGPEK